MDPALADELFLVVATSHTSHMALSTTANAPPGRHLFMLNMSMLL
jgi:hypothetical protein